jgi:hypothetical protein
MIRFHSPYIRVSAGLALERDVRYPKKHPPRKGQAWQTLSAPSTRGFRGSSRHAI